MNIKDATSKAQLEAIGALFREYADAMEHDTCFDSLEREIAGLPGPYAPPDGGLLLAEFDGRPAGCIGLVAASGPSDKPTCGCGSTVEGRRGDVCEMVRLWVRPEFRGRKLGLRLIEAITARARELGYARMRLETLPDRMEKAVTLYRSLGFEEVPIANSKGSARVLVMEKQL